MAEELGTAILLPQSLDAIPLHTAADNPMIDTLMIDTHAHLDLPDFDHDRADVIGRAEQAGVEWIVCVATTVASSEGVVRLAAEYPSVTAAIGVHPNSAAEAAPDDFARVEQLLDEVSRESAAEAPNRVVAIGETGMDRYWDFTPIDVQRAWFARHAELAQARDLPLIVHCREAEEEVLGVLREAAGRGPLRGILHAFSGDERFAADCLELGLHISFAGMVSYTNRKFRPLREVARTIPADRLLIETDSPYLVPHPLRGKQKRNEPALVRLTAEALADLRGEQVEELIARTSANARRLFRLPESG